MKSKYILILVAVVMLTGNCFGQHDADYEALTKQLNVRQRQHLVFCSATPKGVESIDSFLEKYPESKHREQVMYLAAIARWNLFNYADAANAYSAYLKEFPTTRLSSLSMTRLSQSLIRSDQPEKAIKVIDQWKNAAASEQRELHRADALALLGKFDEARLLVQSVIINMERANENERVISVAQQQLKRLQMIGRPLPNFEKKIFGTELTLTPSTFKGKVLLVDFWAAWCRPCMGQMPHLVDIHTEYKNKGFEILGISLDSDEQAMKDALTKVGASWPQYFDGKKWQNDLAVLFDVHRIPMTILVDKDGLVQAVNPPPLAIKRLANQLLAKE